MRGQRELTVLQGILVTRSRRDIRPAQERGIIGHNRAWIARCLLILIGHLPKPPPARAWEVDIQPDRGINRQILGGPAVQLKQRPHAAECPARRCRDARQNPVCAGHTNQLRIRVHRHRRPQFRAKVAQFASVLRRRQGFDLADSQTARVGINHARIDMKTRRIHLHCPVRYRHAP